MKIQFLKDTSKAIIDAPEQTILIYRDGFNYDLPKISGVEYIEFLEYKKKYTYFEPNMVIMVGLNRIITPSNRCDFINEFLQTMTAHIPKISIDNSPFIGEPWRLWFHYSIANCGNFNITYSYIIETEWKHWFYRDINTCRLEKGNIKLVLSDTYSNLDPLVTTFDFKPVDLEWYNKAKEDVFNRYDTPKLIINNLLKMTNKKYNRNITYDSFKNNNKNILPDLGIYRFMSEECIRRKEIYNEVIKNENIS